MRLALPARRRVLEIVGASLVLTALAFLTPPSLFEGQDWQQLHLPGKMYAAYALAEGRLPLWNPYVGLGRPFLADVEMAVLYPPNLLYLLADPATALFLLTLAHYALGLIGLLGLGRALGFSRWVAWLTAGCFLWSAPLTARLSAGLVPYVQASCYLPLLLLLALRLQDRFSAARLAGLAAALGLQLLCGHPQVAWVSWLGIGAFLLGRSLPPHERPVKTAATGLGGFALALVAAFALCAPMLLPFLELVSQGNRMQPSLAFASGGAMDGWSWTSLVVPDGGRRVFPWESNLYAGLLPVVAGVAGLLRVRDRNARGLLLMAVLGALVAAGQRTPVFGLLYHVIPGLASFHLHARAGWLVVVALLLGAALYLSRPSTLAGAIRALGLGSALVLAGALAFATAAPEAGPASVPLERVLLAVTVAGLAGLVVTGRPRGRAWLAPAALSAVVLLELGASIGPAKRAWFTPAPKQGERLVFETLLRFGLFDRSGLPPRVAIPPAFARANAGPIYGWSGFGGYNSLTLDRVWVYLHRALGLEVPLDENTYPSARIYERGPFPYDSMNLTLGWNLEERRPVVRTAADPRAYLATAARRVGDWREAVERMASGHDFHTEALVEAETGLPTRAEAGSPTPGTVTLTSFAPERIALTSESDSAALLVLAEAWYPGWSASVDGRAAPCVPANGWMRAVSLPPGHHEVRLVFRSRWLAAGAFLSLATAAALALASWRSLRRPAPLPS